MPDIPLSNDRSGVVLPVLVVPGASRSEVVGPHGPALRIRVAVPADKGRANREAERLLAEFFGARVSLVSGHASRRKRFLLEELDRDSVRRRIAEAGS